ncbi:general secretion pathway protein H [Sulfurifustis variabilis]|uniref:Type II secretion system protein H n=1 Tax=Sulfurifustis variabilis TaxID=1675686 RepID=A0A1B4VBT7_9GAMM|nr:GspH/FimT family protein [Sulfurifustis variabilis]BAU50064.1 general secretion pathway protein H [Sulfurifustis variabilis]
MESGFTLLELLVVLVLAASVAALVAPALSGAVALAELKAGARTLASALRHARGRAIAEHRDVALLLDVEARTWRVTGQERTHRLVSRLDLRLYTAQSEVTSRDAGSIRFFPDGSSTGGRITLAARNRAYVVDVAWLTGRVTIHD